MAGSRSGSTASSRSSPAASRSATSSHSPRRPPEPTRSRALRRLSTPTSCASWRCARSSNRRRSTQVTARRADTWSVDQVSKPVLIALAAVLVFVVAHFTVLAPKTSSGPAPAPQAPGQQGLENAIGKANNAVSQSQSSANRTEQAAAAASGDPTASASKPAATPAAKKASAAKPAAAPAKPLPKLAKGDRSGPMLRNLSNGKVVVALFYTPHGADDNAALRAVRTADRHHGKVIVHSIPVDHVGDYDALTTDVQVLQAPTILVIGPNFKARTIVGYTEVKEVDQMVGDVGGRGFTARPAKHLTGWAAKASEICKDNGFRIQTSGTPTSSGELAPYLTHATKLEG